MEERRASALLYDGRAETFAFSGGFGEGQQFWVEGHQRSSQLRAHPYKPGVGHPQRSRSAMAVAEIDEIDDRSFLQRNSLLFGDDLHAREMDGKWRWARSRMKAR